MSRDQSNLLNDFDIPNDHPNITVGNYLPISSFSQLDHLGKMISSDLEFHNPESKYYYSSPYQWNVRLKKSLKSS